MKDEHKGKKLESLEEHDKRWLDKYFSFTQKRRNMPCGVACPKCGTELLADRTRLLLSFPPQTPIHCPKCNYSGSMY